MSKSYKDKRKPGVLSEHRKKVKIKAMDKAKVDFLDEYDNIHESSYWNSGIENKLRLKAG